MTAQQLRDFLDAQPFQPFVMHLADGQPIPVVHPEFALPSPNGRTVLVYQPDDSLNVANLRLVTDLEIKSNGQAKRNEP